MSKPLIMSAYPSEYLDLFEVAIARDEPIILTLSSKREAENLRFDLYGFRKAAHLEEYPKAIRFSQLKLRVVGKTLEISKPLTSTSVISEVLTSLPGTPSLKEEKLSDDFRDFLKHELDDTQPSQSLEDVLRSLKFFPSKGDS